MPTYEALILMRPRIVKEVAGQTMKAITKTVLSSGGVVRSVAQLEADHTPLPHRTRAHKEYFTSSWPWVVKFDASPVVANELQASLRLNTDVLRATFCKQPSVASNPNPRFHKCKNLGRPNDKDDVETTFTSTSGLGGR